MDRLVLKGLKFHAFHGYFEHERVNGNHFEIDLVFTASFSKAGNTDDLNSAIDYTLAQEIVSSVMQGESQKLIERLTFLIGEELSKTFPFAQKIEVSLRKMNPPISIKADYSEVTMSWPR